MGKEHRVGEDPPRARPSVELFVSKALELGASAAKLVRTSSVVTAPWVRLKCQYGCGGWGKRLSCPPRTPAPYEMRDILDCYREAVLFEAGRREPSRIAAALEREAFLAGYYRAFGLGSGPCRLCEDCALDEGCRHPSEARPSMEACGIDVFATVRANGFEIEVVRDREDPQHYFGLVLVE